MLLTLKPPPLTPKKLEIRVRFRTRRRRKEEEGGGRGGRRRKELGGGRNKGRRREGGRKRGRGGGGRGSSHEPDPDLQFFQGSEMVVLRLMYQYIITASA